MIFLANLGLGGKLDIGLEGPDDEVSEVVVLAEIQETVGSPAAGSGTDA